MMARIRQDITRTGLDESAMNDPIVEVAPAH
jgi:hypothetical protein